MGPFHQRVALIAAIVMGSGAVGAWPGEAPAQPPNLIIILADDLGYGDLGVYGGEVIKSPNIDALAASGVRFTDGYVAAAVCSPSRAALMTGRYPQRFGYHFNNNAGPGLPTSETTIATRLKAAGYATGIIGKWQLGMQDDRYPLARGFDEFFGMASGTIYIAPDTPGVESFSPVPLPKTRQHPIYRGRQQVEVDGYITDVFTTEAVDFIDRHHDRPFFLYLAHFAPHVPLQATAKYLERYAHVEDTTTRIFAAMVSAVDDSVGAVVGALEKHGIRENTLIVFLSDNGCAQYLGGACSNRPLNGGKRYFWDGGIRVPLLLSWPARLPKSTVFSQPASSIDLTATLLVAATGDHELPAELDGVDLIPFLLNERPGAPHQRLFWRAGPNRAIRDGRWKLWQVNRTTEDRLAEVGIAGLLPRYSAPNDSPLGQLTLLYDLEADVGERSNIAPANPEVVERLLSSIDAWNGDMKDPSVVSTRGTATTIDGVPVEIIF